MGETNVPNNDPMIRTPNPKIRSPKKITMVSTEQLTLAKLVVITGTSLIVTLTIYALSYK